IVGILPEGAVRATVAAEIRDRQEHLPRVRDRPSLAAVAELARRTEQHRKSGVVAANERIRVEHGERRAGADARENAGGIAIVHHGCVVPQRRRGISAPRRQVNEPARFQAACTSKRPWSWASYGSTVTRRPISRSRRSIATLSSSQRYAATAACAR